MGDGVEEDHSAERDGRLGAGDARVARSPAKLGSAGAAGGAGNGKDGKDAEGPDKPQDVDGVLDGVPEWFIGPLLKDVIMHEVGHPLGLRHNFQASSIYGMKEVNTTEFKSKAITGSVMDY